MTYINKRMYEDALKAAEAWQKDYECQKADALHWHAEYCAARLELDLLPWVFLAAMVLAVSVVYLLNV